MVVWFGLDGFAGAALFCCATVQAAAKTKITVNRNVFLMADFPAIQTRHSAAKLQAAGEPGVCGAKAPGRSRRARTWVPRPSHRMAGWSYSKRSASIGSRRAALRAG